MVRFADDVLRNIDEAAEQLVDARPPGRFEGRYPLVLSGQKAAWFSQSLTPQNSNLHFQKQFHF